MKFLKREYDALRQVIIKNHKDPNKFHQIKKRGHLYVQEEGREDMFCFFRKKTTALNKNLQWEDQEQYFLDPKNKIQVETFDEVLVAFEIWLTK